MKLNRLLSADMWEIFYSEDININNEINGYAVYLVRLNPYKLLEIWEKITKPQRKIFAVSLEL